jgi:hypothetical protein
VEPEDLRSSPRQRELTDQLQKATLDGTPLDLRSGDASEDYPIGGPQWGHERVLLADTIVRIIRAAEPHPGRIRGLHVCGARIVGDLALDYVCPGCAIVFEECYFECPVSMRESRIAALRLSGCVLKEGFDGRGMTVDGSLTLNRGSYFLADVRLDAAHVKTWVDFIGGHFWQPDGVALSANGLQVGDDMLCGDSKLARSDPRVAVPEGGERRDGERFVALGQVRLARAHIAGQLYCTGGIFRKGGDIALFADSLTVDGRVACGRGFIAAGQVNLRRATIAGQLRFEGVSSAPPKKLPAGSEKQAEEIIWHLEAARVGRALVFKPARALDGVVNLINAQTAYLRDNEHSWTPKRYALYNLNFGQIAGPKEQRDDGSWLPQGKDRDWRRRDKAVTARLDWLKHDRDGFHGHLHDQLARHYRQIGHDTSERRVLINKQWRRFGVLGWRGRAWNLVSWLLWGYGYRVWQVIIWFAALFAFGAHYFDTPHHSRVMEHLPKAPEFSSEIYSLDLLLPVINLSQRESWVARGADPKIVATGMIIAGWILATTFVAGLTGIVKRPND